MMIAPLDKIQSKTIDWLRFAMAVLVVVLHTGAWGIKSEFPIYRTLCILTTKGICQLAVPCFFLFSGFLFFRDLCDWNWNQWKEKIRRRFFSLFIPYLLWNIIAFVCFFLYHLLRCKLGSTSEPFIGDEPNSVGSLLKYIFWGHGQGNMPVDYPLWFIRDLILYTLITPLIYLFCKYLDIYGVIALSLCIIVFSIFPIGIWFYVLGCWLGISGKGLISISIDRYKWIMLILSIILLYLVIWSYERHASFYYPILYLFTIVGSFCSISFVRWGIQRGHLHVNSFLAGSAFFIFATHGILILDDFSHYIILHITHIHEELYYCCDLFFRPLIAIGICLGLYYLMNNIIPKMTRVLIGAR